MKTLATLTAASLLTLAGVAAAQTTTPTPAPTTPPSTTPAPAPSTPPAAAPAAERPVRGPGMSRADFDALTDAWIAAIQAGLKLNPEQQRLWTPVEEALRAQAAERANRFEERRRMMAERRDDRGGADRDGDITQRLERRAEWASRRAQRATENAQRMTALSNAMKPFYASLDENQKRLLPVLLRRHEDGRRMGAYGRRDGMAGHHRWGMMGRDHMDGGMRRGMMGRDGDTDRGMGRWGMMGRDRDGMDRPWWNRDGMDRDRYR